METYSNEATSSPIYATADPPAPARTTESPDRHPASKVIQRTSPASPETENGFISIALIDAQRAFTAAAEVGLTKHDFHQPSTSLIFDILQEYWMDNEPVDTAILTRLLRDRELLSTCGGRINEEHWTGAGYITALGSLMPTIHVADSYAATIKKKSARRRSIDHLSTTLDTAYDTTTDDAEFMEGAEKALMEIVKMREGEKINTRTMKELVMRAMERIDHRIHGDWKIEMPTGIAALDKVTLGFKAPMVTMVLGKPSDGKSSLAMNIAEHLALHCKKKVGIISMDDSDDQLADRIIQARSRVSRWEIEQTGHLSDQDRDLLLMAANDIGNASDRLFIRDDGGLTPSEISATFTAWKAKGGLDFGIIDHIQLAQTDNKKSDSRTSAAEEVSRTLKPMAKRLGIPLLVLSQVTEDNGGNYTTKNTRALGEDANNVWTLKRMPDSTDAWIHISKQKDGPRGISVPVKYEKEFTRFSDRDHGSVDDSQPDLVQMPPPAKRSRNGSRK